MTTFEEAKRCPQCDTPGEERQAVGLGREHGQMHYVYCVNEKCLWYDTCWMVQTLPDGTIPVRPPDSPTGEIAGKMAVQEMVDLGKRYMDGIISREQRGTNLD